MISRITANRPRFAFAAAIRNATLACPLLFAMQCASFATTESGTAFPGLPPESESPADRAASPAPVGSAGERPRDPGAIEPGQVSAIALRFTAWGNHQRYIPDLRERLQLRGYRLRQPDGDIPDTLEVVLEESETTPGGLRLLNFFATIASGTLVPFYNQVNYRLTYRHFRGGVLRSACRYELRNNEFLSVLAIPLAPFYWSTSVLAETLERTVDAYAYGCVPLDTLPAG